MAELDFQTDLIVEQLVDLDLRRDLAMLVAFEAEAGQRCQVAEIRTEAFEVLVHCDWCQIQTCRRACQL